MLDTELGASVYHLFNEWGHIISVKVNRDGMYRPYAFVQYESVEDSKNALRYAPGTLLNGRIIRCEPARVNRTICITSIHRAYDEEKLHLQLSSFGEIEDITIITTYQYIRCAFIKYCYREDAMDALKALSSSIHCPGFVQWSQNIDSHPGRSHYKITYIDQHSIFIGNLDPQTNDQDLNDKFSQYGTIIHSQIHNRKKRAFAFIRYQHGYETSKAILSEEGNHWKGNMIHVSYREYRSSLDLSRVVPHMIILPVKLPTLLLLPYKPIESTDRPYSAVHALNSNHVNMPIPYYIQGRSPGRLLHQTDIHDFVTVWVIQFIHRFLWSFLTMVGAETSQVDPHHRAFNSPLGYELDPMSTQ
ncbi:hypothetical protein BDB01DRAFT_877297 [Pilobolus umbonatus]|nr:hypothetical protein BDB01DRAFT_877297 [Pilobolus umbonatus]